VFSKGKQINFRNPRLPANRGFFAFTDCEPEFLKKFMKTNRVIARFEPETHFEVAPIAPVPFRGTQETELDRLKARLLKQLLDQTEDPQLYAPLRRAANEAAGLAWFTPFPLLFFPALLEEKAVAVQRQGTRQRRIRQRSQSLLAVAEV
jgi:hypothetical protein